MEKSFNSWREPEEESESDADVVEGSTCILEPDSDCESSPSNNQLSVKDEIIVPASSEEDESVPGPSSAPQKPSNSSKSSVNLSSSKNTSCSNLSSPDEIKFASAKKNKHRIIDSDSSSDEEKNTGNGLKLIEDEETSSENSCTFQDDNVCSSTRFVEGDHNSSSGISPSNGTSSIKSNSSKSFSVLSKGDTISTVDLTLLEDNTSEKDKYRNPIQNVNNQIIVVDSDSDDPSLKSTSRSKLDKRAQGDLNQQLNLLKISPYFSGEQKKKPSELTNVNSSSNDYVSRTESLKAEDEKLKMLVSDALKNIESTKASLKSANLSALPDRGVRLKQYLQKQESQLRDLRYQQSTLANEIIKQQLMSNNSQQHIPLPPKLEQKMYRLPTTSTDLNTMGKKAMETHRNQQALTIDALRALHNSLKNCPNEETVVTDPKGIRVELMPHQKHALAWLLWREKEKPSGGILADDMGLGKTLTMISLILKSEEENIKDGSGDSGEESDEEKNTSWMSNARSNLVQGKTLVVCPATLLGQWEGEIQNKLKRGLLDVVVHHGSNREKHPKRLARPDVVITTYNIVSRDSSNPQSPLFQIRWKRVILDEAHQIRNSKTQTAQSVFQLKAKSRWALTGTPVHNKEIDLYALLKFLRVSPFDDITVWKRWVDNRDAAGMQRLSTITKSLMLRRTKVGLQEKGELKSLTERKFHQLFITLDKEELAAYEKLLNFSKTLFSQFLHQKAEKENALTGIPVPTKQSHYLHNVDNPFEKHPELARLHKKMRDIPDVKSHDILVIILRLRQFCCHPALITSMLEKEDVASVGIEDNEGLDIDLVDKLTRMSLNIEETVNVNSENKDVASALSTANPLFAQDRLSSKMRKVLETMENILKGEDKVVVVSQWVSLLNLMHSVLRERKIKCALLTGAVPVKDRPAIVDKFNRIGHSPRVMLLSLTAGGVGLNLVGGNHLILLDLHWNPQLESQACDRIYRVGQEKNVQVYKFVTSETIEERILKLQEKKLEIANDVLTGAKHTSKLSLDDLKMLFQITK